MSADTKEKTKVDTEGTDVGTSLTADPEDTKVALIVELVVLALVNGTDTELALDGGDERRALEESTGQGLQSAGKLSLATGDLVVETDHANVLLTGTLLRLDQTGGAVNADDQTSSDLRIKGTTVTSLLGSVKKLAISIIFKPLGKSNNDLPEDPLHPSHDFVTGRVRRLVEVDDTGTDVGLQVTAQRGRASRDRGEVTGANEYYKKSQCRLVKNGDLRTSVRFS